MEIGVEREHFGISSENIETVREGTIFIDLSILFDVFDELLKCPDCGEDITSHENMDIPTALFYSVRHASGSLVLIPPRNKGSLTKLTSEQSWPFVKLEKGTIQW